METAAARICRTGVSPQRAIMMPDPVLGHGHPSAVSPAAGLPAGRAQRSRGACPGQTAKFRESGQSRRPALFPEDGNGRVSRGAPDWLPPAVSSASCGVGPLESSIVDHERPLMRCGA